MSTEGFMVASMTHDAHPTTPSQALAWKSVKWRNAAGWVLVAIITARYLIHPIVSAVLVTQGAAPLDALPDISLPDVAAIVGLPIGGSFADKLAGDN